MVTMGVLCFVISGAFILTIIKKLRKFVTHKGMLYAILHWASFYVSYRIWMVLTEVGRQPWIVRGYMRVSEALRKQGNNISYYTIWITLLSITLYISICTHSYVQR